MGGDRKSNEDTVTSSGGGEAAREGEGEGVEWTGKGKTGFGGKSQPSVWKVYSSRESVFIA